MKIDGVASINAPTIVPASAASLTMQASSQEASQRAGVLGADTTAISHESALFAATMSLPDVDSAKVSSVQAALRDGKFHVESGAIASSLMEDMFKPLPGGRQ